MSQIKLNKCDGEDNECDWVTNLMVIKFCNFTTFESSYVIFFPEKKMNL